MSVTEVVFAEPVARPSCGVAVALLRIEGKGGPLGRRAWRLTVTRLLDGEMLVEETEPNLGSIFPRLYAALAPMPGGVWERACAQIRESVGPDNRRRSPGGAR